MLLHQLQFKYPAVERVLNDTLFAAGISRLLNSKQNNTQEKLGVFFHFSVLSEIMINHLGRRDL